MTLMMIISTMLNMLVMAMLMTCGDDDVVDDDDDDCEINAKPPGASVEDSGRHPAQQRQRREGRGSLELSKGTGFLGRGYN